MVELTKSLDGLEKLIGLSFKDSHRLELALTHSSLKQGRDAANYERMEFLGDRVLGLAIAERLFVEFPTAPEGELSVRLNMLVSAETCAAIADELGLGRYIRHGGELTKLAAQRTRNIRADVVEALIAAIYLEHGYGAARDFVMKHWGSRITAPASARRDPKTELQEWAHQKVGRPPAYALIDRSGPDHEPLFTVSANIDGIAPATGKGRSKRQAETAAAETILRREGIWPKG